MTEKLDDKYYQYLIHFFDAPDTLHICEFLRHCDIFLRQDNSFSKDRVTLIYVHPEVYKKTGDLVHNYKKIICRKLTEVAPIKSSFVEIYPDLSKFQIIKNTYTPVTTPWQEINTGQNHLLSLLRSAEKTVDFQNIGNTSRTLMQTLSNLVFDAKKHTPNDVDVDLSEGKFKNRLHSFIKTEIAGDKNKELRDFSIALINAAEKSIDLSNKLTHDLKANSMYAESCVISTIAAIGIVKLIK